MLTLEPAAPRGSSLFFFVDSRGRLNNATMECYGWCKRGRYFQVLLSSLLTKGLERYRLISHLPCSIDVFLLTLEVLVLCWNGRLYSVSEFRLSAKPCTWKFNVM